VLIIRVSAVASTAREGYALTSWAVAYLVLANRDGLLRILFRYRGHQSIKRLWEGRSCRPESRFFKEGEL